MLLEKITKSLLPISYSKGGEQTKMKSLPVFLILSTLVGLPTSAYLFSTAGLGQYVPVIYTDTWQYVRTVQDTTTSTTLEPMPYTEVTITLLAPCDLRITFSGSMKLYYQIPKQQEEIHAASFESLRIAARIVGLPVQYAYPIEAIALQRSSCDEIDTGYQAVSFTFVRDNVPAGTYTVKIYWGVSTTYFWGYVTYRSLVVTANGAGHV